MAKNPETRALYNADCPICNSEMCTYAEYADHNDLPIAFDDLNSGNLANWGVTEDDATRLLHVVHKGQLYIGFDAMLVLWDQMPRYRLLAKLCRTPGLVQVLTWGYTHIVARIIYNRHLRRKERGLVATQSRS